MTHPPELSLAMLADGALDAHAAAALEQHLTACERCGAVAALREESHALAAALAYDGAAVSVPEFVKPASVRAMVAGSAAVPCSSQRCSPREA